MVTLLIVGRIWFTSRRMKAYTMTSTRKVSAIMIESGVLYFLVQLVFVTLYGMNIAAEQVIIPMAVQVYVRVTLIFSAVIWVINDLPCRALPLSSLSFNLVWGSLSNTEIEHSRMHQPAQTGDVYSSVGYTPRTSPRRGLTTRTVRTETI